MAIELACPTTRAPLSSTLNSSNIPLASAVAVLASNSSSLSGWILGRRFFLLETDEEAEATDIMPIKCQLLNMILLS
jgi:membrane protein YqaA with SNARE-associated domain